MIYSHRTGLLDHLWSLCVEEHSYILLAVIAAAVREPRTAMAVLLTLGSAALMNGIVRSALTDTWFPNAAWRTDVQVAPLFIAGALYLLARRARWAQQSWISPACLILGITVKLCSTNALIQFGLGTLLLSMSIATIDHALMSFKQLLEPAPLRQIGLGSFSLYLWQQPFYKLVHEHVAPAGLLAVAALCAGLASFHVVEVPARLLINRRWAAPAPRRSRPEAESPRRNARAV